MAENEKKAYLALIAAHDPAIRTLLDQGFDFVTNAFKVRRGAVRHEGQDGSGTRAKVATRRLSSA